MELSKLQEAIKAEFPQGVTFTPTYDADVWADFMVKGHSDRFHMVDGYLFGATEEDAKDRFVFCRNNDPELGGDQEDERAGATVAEVVAHLK